MNKQTRMIQPLSNGDYLYNEALLDTIEYCESIFGIPHHQLFLKVREAYFNHSWVYDLKHNRPYLLILKTFFIANTQCTHLNQVKDDDSIWLRHPSFPSKHWIFHNMDKYPTTDKYYIDWVDKVFNNMMIYQPGLEIFRNRDICEEIIEKVKLTLLIYRLSDWENMDVSKLSEKMGYIMGTVFDISLEKDIMKAMEQANNYFKESGTFNRKLTNKEMFLMKVFNISPKIK